MRLFNLMSTRNCKKSYLNKPLLLYEYGLDIMGMYNRGDETYNTISFDFPRRYGIFKNVIF